MRWFKKKSFKMERSFIVVFCFVLFPVKGADLPAVRRF